MFVVPVSFKNTPANFIISGILKEPPISTSSPLETITSFPSANSLRHRTTAAALLFTASAPSAPVILQMSFSRWEILEPLFPFSISYSRLQYEVTISKRCFPVSLEKIPLPRFV